MAAPLFAPPPSPTLSSNLPSISRARNSFSTRKRRCPLLGRSPLFVSSRYSAPTSTKTSSRRRRDFMFSGLTASLVLAVPFSDSHAVVELNEDVKMALLLDDINAYSFLYPVELPMKKFSFKWVESRKPERYSSAAPLSPDARQRIVSERVDMINNLVISVSVYVETTVLSIKRRVYLLTEPYELVAYIYNPVKSAFSDMPLKDFLIYMPSCLQKFPSVKNCYTMKQSFPVNSMKFRPKGKAVFGKNYISRGA